MPSNFFNPWEDLLSPIVNPVDVVGRGGPLVLDAEDLPLLRQQLELRLKEAETAEGMSRAVIRRVRAGLDEVAEVEKQLAERAK